MLGGVAGLAYVLVLFLGALGGSVTGSTTPYAVLFVAYFGSTFIATYLLQRESPAVHGGEDVTSSFRSSSSKTSVSPSCSAGPRRPFGTRGESLGAHAGVGLVTVVPVVLAAVIGFGTLVVMGNIARLASLLGIVVLVGLVLVAGLIGQTLAGIAKTALYVYATEDRAPRYFEDMDFGASTR